LLNKSAQSISVLLQPKVSVVRGTVRAGTPENPVTSQIRGDGRRGAKKEQRGTKEEQRASKEPPKGSFHPRVVYRTSAFGDFRGAPPRKTTVEIFTEPSSIFCEKVQQ
jgi:hypothetical protein